jgi:hypothetical protein
VFLGGKNWIRKMRLQVSKSLKCLILMKSMFGGYQGILFLSILSPSC